MSKQYLDKDGLEVVRNKVNEARETAAGAMALAQAAMESSGQDIYSTTETKTNKVWIDGKPIYRKVVVSDSGIPNNSTLATNVRKMISGTGTWRYTVDNHESTIPAATTAGWGFRSDWNSSTNEITLTGYGSIPDAIIVTCMILEYTKTTD